jgi:hypothetical protein
MVSGRRVLLFKDKPLMGFGLIVIAVCLANFILNNVNGRFWLSDFNVYYTAAKNLISGGPVYLHAFGDGSGYYKYSPVILCFFLPYAAFSYYAASVIHFAILSFSFFYAFLLVYRMLKKYFFLESIGKEWFLLVLAFGCMVIHLVRELYLGNINIILLCLSLLALQNYLDGRNRSGSILLGIILLTKPFYLLLLLPLFFRKKLKAIGILAITVAAGLIFPFIFMGYDRTLSFYSGWIRIMMLHGTVFPGKNTLEYMVRYYFIPGLPMYAGLIILLVMVIFSCIFIWFNLEQEKNRTATGYFRDQDFIFEWWMLLALIPNLFRTDSEHFLSTAPLLAFIVFFIASRRIFWMIPVMIVLIFFYGANSTDLLGSNLSDRLFSMGLLGLSNLLLIMLACGVFLAFKKSTYLLNGSVDKQGNSPQG